MEHQFREPILVSQSSHAVLDKNTSNAAFKTPGDYYNISVLIKREESKANILPPYKAPNDIESKSEQSSLN